MRRTAAWWKATVATMPRAVNFTDTAQPRRKPVTTTQATLAGPERPRVTDANDAPRAATSNKYIQLSQTMMRDYSDEEGSSASTRSTVASLEPGILPSPGAQKLFPSA